jgi:multimeric flavodoxin WrbA
MAASHPASPGSNHSSTAKTTVSRHSPLALLPNYSLGPAQDWMNEIYPLWVETHGVMIVTPANWYQVFSPLKLMMDRLVCADGDNPDSNCTGGKNAQCANQIELGGRDYPRHLAGRLFSVIVHGDAEGTGGMRHSLADWLASMQLIPAGPLAPLVAGLLCDRVRAGPGGAGLAPAAACRPPFARSGAAWAASWRFPNAECPVVFRRGVGCVWVFGCGERI